MKTKILFILCVITLLSMQTPERPRVLIIGDSISIGYTPFVKKLLADVADVTRPTANCGSTRIGLRDIDKWLGDTAWTVIHFNFGVHDLGYRFADDRIQDNNGVYATPNNGGHQNVSLEEYESNLRKISTRLKKTGAKLIFATTTPISADLNAYVKDTEQPYNKVALRVMKDENIEVNDLWEYIKPQIDTTQIPGNPHFTSKGSKVLAQKVAESIRKSIIKHN
jgi:acyl-CoA thioesterase-1